MGDRTWDRSSPALDTNEVRARKAAGCVERFHSFLTVKMGTSASKEPPPTVICVGLDAAGKTTLLYKVKENGGGQVETTIPTIGAHSS